MLDYMQCIKSVISVTNFMLQLIVYLLNVFSSPMVYTLRLSNSVSHNNTLHTQNIDVVGEIINQASIPVYVKSPSLQSGTWIKQVSSPMTRGNNYWQMFIVASDVSP